MLTSEMPRPSKSPEEQPRPLTIRIPPDVWAYLESHAESEDRSVNYIAIRLMRLGLAAERGELG